MKYSKDITKEVKVEFVEHPSAKRIVLSWFRRDHPRMSERKLLSMRTEFTVLLGCRWTDGATVAQMISVVREVGAWAYCHHVSPRHKEVHYWFSKAADPFMVYEVILHEVAHAAGYSSEATACKIAGIGVFCLQVLTDYFGGMRGKGGRDAGTSREKVGRLHGGDQ